MKKIMIAVAILFVAGTVGFAQNKKVNSHKQHNKKEVSANKFTCHMHPEILTTKPGNCPNCGMALVPVKKKMGNGKGKGNGHS